MPLAPFAFVSSSEVSFFAQAGVDYNYPIFVFCVAGITGVHYYAWLMHVISTLTSILESSVIQKTI
jgi:hypothetical protein